MNDILKDFKFPDPKTNVWIGNQEKDVPPYILSPEIITTLKVAFVTKRPLLVSGPPGCGKSTLAKAIAYSQEWSYLKHTLTSRSRVEDLTGEVDQLQRLHDAHVQALSDDWTYLKPGLFWWGFNEESATRKGRSQDEVNKQKNFRTPAKPKTLRSNSNGIVILLDEIDKAEPDLPNDLLEPLDQRSFQLNDGTEVNAPKELTILVIITTNGERDLPSAFVRRCIRLELQTPNTESLISIAKFHFSDTNVNNKNQLFKSVAEKFVSWSKEAAAYGHRTPGTSEYLDAVLACIELNINPDSDIWEHVERATLRKLFSPEENIQYE